jgi:hypothetical protein
MPTNTVTKPQTMLEKLAAHLGLAKGTLAEVALPVLQLLVDDCFNRHDSDSERDYREIAIDRAVASGCYFVSECNTIHNIAKRFIKCVCPYCGKDMTPKGGGGNCSTYTENYECTCGAGISLTFGNDGIGVRPKENKLEKL